MVEPLTEQTLGFSELQQVGELVRAHRWTFAKTMPKEPHWYTLRKDWASEADFAWVVEQSRAGGFQERYRGRRVSGMLNVSGFKYWTLGYPVSLTTVLNRRPVDRLAASYDAVAERYDALFASPTCLGENRLVFDLVNSVGGSVLDVGCGTGLALEYLKPGRYVGLDPSHAMLDRLRAKHEHAETIPCRLEEYAADQAFDLVLCLFGAANYIRPEYVAAIPRLVRPGGTYVVMFWRDGYVPQIHGLLEPPRHWPGMHVELPGERFPIGDYVAVRGTG